MRASGAYSRDHPRSTDESICIVGLHMTVIDCGALCVREVLAKRANRNARASVCECTGDCGDKVRLVRAFLSARVTSQVRAQPFLQHY